MSSEEGRPSGEALRLYQDEYLNDLIDALVAQSMEALVCTDPNDTARLAKRQGEALALRNLRSQLKALSEGKTKAVPRGFRPPA